MSAWTSPFPTNATNCGAPLTVRWCSVRPGHELSGGARHLDVLPEQTPVWVLQSGRIVPLSSRRELSGKLRMKIILLRHLRDAC